MTSRFKTYSTFSKRIMLSFFFASAEPPRFKASTSPDIVEQYISRGIPVIIEDAVGDSSFKEWDCDYMSKTFSQTKFRREYDEQNMGDQNQESLGLSKT